MKVSITASIGLNKVGDVAGRAKVGKSYVTCCGRRVDTNALRLIPLNPGLVGCLPLRFHRCSLTAILSRVLHLFLSPSIHAAMADYSNQNRGQEDDEDEEDIDETVITLFLPHKQTYIDLGRATKPSKMLFFSPLMSARPCL